MPIAPPTVTADSVYVFSHDTAEVYYEKGLDAPAGGDDPVSLTKNMTIYIILREYPTKAELDGINVTIVADDLLIDGSGDNLNAGDIWTMHELLANALIPSSNNATMAIAAHIGRELLGNPSAAHADAVAEFVAEMNTVAASLSMSDTTYFSPHGFETDTVSSVEDQATIFGEVCDNDIILDICRFQTYRFNITRGGSPAVVTDSGSGWLGRIGVSCAKNGTRGTANVFNQEIFWEAPNGQRLVVAVMGSSSQANRDADVVAILAELVIDFPELATPGTPWTPQYAFTDLACGGGYWDLEDADTLWQDDAGTTPAVADDPVGRWDSIAGTAGVYWRQATAGSKPTLRNDAGVWNLQGDGGDIMSLGDDEIGATGLFPGTGDQFMVFTISRTEAANGGGTIIAKASATAASRTNQMYYENATTREPGTTLRGTVAGTSMSLNNGSYQNIDQFWDEDRFGLCMNETGTHNVAVGSAAEEVQNITLFGRTESAPGFMLTGRIGNLLLIFDTYDRDQFRRARDWMRGATVNAFHDPAGGAGSGVSARMALLGVGV